MRVSTTSQVSSARTTHSVVRDAVIANSSNIGTGWRCFPLHLWKAELVLVGRGLLNLGVTTAFHPCKFGCDFLKNPSSSLSTDDLLSLDVAEALFGLIPYTP